jgi:hypothetical protein
MCLFDTLVTIANRLDSSKNTETMARLIALALGAVGSYLRRDLIYAVFGLLSLIGHHAETVPREDSSQRRPLPVTDLMSYSALGIVFGPLLIGDDINSSTTGAYNINAKLEPLQTPQSNRWRLRRRSKDLADGYPGTASMDRVHVANNITELIITHWQRIVKHTKSLALLETSPRSRPSLWSSVSDSLLVRGLGDWEVLRPASWPTAMGGPPASSSPALEASKSLPGIVPMKLTYEKRSR